MYQLESGEKIIRQVRKHWLPFVLEFLFLLFLAVLPLIAYVFVSDFVADKLAPVVVGDPTVLFLFVYLLWLVILWMILFYIWTDYYLDVWIITNRRIIDIEQKGFFNREVSSFRMDRLQDITISVEGFIATIFGFGNINVETASSDNNFVIPNASHPESVKNTILEQHNIAMEKTNRPL
ncbi:MAG: PH domain-containing protein [Patescibacteria group bacterium]